MENLNDLKKRWLASGDIDALTILGLLELLGIYTDNDTEKLLTPLKAKSKEGRLASMCLLAELFLMQSHVRSQNSESQRRILATYSDWKNRRRTSRPGARPTPVQLQFSVKRKEFNEAMDILRSAAKSGCRPAKMRLAGLLEATKQFDDAIAIYEAEAQAGEYKASERLAFIFDPISGPVPDSERAKYFLDLAKQLRSPENSSD